MSSVKIIKLNPKLEVAVSIDSRGIMEHWDSDTYEFPHKKLTFAYKLETDYVELLKNKIGVISVTISHNGELIAYYCKDRIIRVFVFNTGKLYRKFREPLEKYTDWQKDNKNSILALDKTEYERRIILEKEIDKNIDSISSINIQFNETDNYIIWSSFMGIKIVDIDKGRVS